MRKEEKGFVGLKFLFDEDLILDLDSLFLGKEKLKSNSPQYMFLGTKLRDVEKELGCLKSVLKRLLILEGEINSVFDLMAGCGFSARMFEKYLPLSHLFLNDLDEGCYRILKTNFLDAWVFQNDLLSLGQIKNVDLAFVDFNSFTITTKNVDYWSSVFDNTLKRVKWLLLTDSACYGFKFGNLNSYGVSSPKEYYEKVGEVFRSKFGWNLVGLSKFSNAALLLFSRKNLPFEEMPGENIHIKRIGKTKGIFDC